MKVTYLNHSGFLLEWEQSYWIFDYFKGELPILDPSKDIYVFSSHSHEDHFNPKIFDLLAAYPLVTYIFSAEIRNRFEQLSQVPESKLPDVHFLENHTNTVFETSSNELLEVYTLKSTDLGCAFYINYCGKTIYHAGDLHWWYWEDEPDDWNTDITEAYKKEIEYLKGKTIDLAFNVLDPRQEKDYALGMNHFISLTQATHLFPMHFWDNFDIIERYKKEYSIPKMTSFYTLHQDGQTFEIML